MIHVKVFVGKGLWKMLYTFKISISAVLWRSILVGTNKDSCFKRNKHSHPSSICLGVKNSVYSKIVTYVFKKNYIDLLNKRTSDIRWHVVKLLRKDWIVSPQKSVGNWIVLEFKGSNLKFKKGKHQTYQFWKFLFLENGWVVLVKELIVHLFLIMSLNYIIWKAKWGNEHSPRNTSYYEQNIVIFPLPFLHLWLSRLSYCVWNNLWVIFL